MTELKRATVLLTLLERLKAHGSWCGETHLQKAIFIIQDIAKSNLGYKFVMYKHGPYSFDLKNELAAMKASDVIEFTFPQEGYGPSIKATKFGAGTPVNSANSFTPMISIVWRRASSTLRPSAPSINEAINSRAYCGR